MRSPVRRLTGPAVLLAVALPLLGTFHECEDENKGQCAPGPAGTYALVLDNDSLTGDFNCTGIVSVTATIAPAGTGFQISYLGKGPYAVTVSGRTYSWMEDSTVQSVHALAEYSIDLSGCTVGGDGTFTLEFLNGGNPCSGVTSITGRKTA
jgi:hypothetical protein